MHNLSQKLVTAQAFTAQPLTVLPLASINASGTSTRALYSALATHMFFGQQSDLEIRVHQDAVQPYFTVELPELAGLSGETKKALLFDACLAQTAEQWLNIEPELPLNQIEQLLVATSIMAPDQAQRAIAQQQWEQQVSQSVAESWPQLVDKLRFEYVYEPAADALIASYIQTPDASAITLMMCVDSLVDYSSVKQLNQHLAIQCRQGDAGVMPAEGATSTLLLPSNTTLARNTVLPTKTSPSINRPLAVTTQAPSHVNMLQLEALYLNPTEGPHPSCQQQLEQAGFTLPEVVLHVGTNSEHWHKHWYAQTQGFYHNESNQQGVDARLSGEASDEFSQQASQESNFELADKTIEVHDQTQVLGYLGVANLPTALASAAGLLGCPLYGHLSQSLSQQNTQQRVWIVEHQVDPNSAGDDCIRAYRVTANATQESTNQTTAYAEQKG